MNSNLIFFSNSESREVPPPDYPLSVQDYLMYQTYEQAIKQTVLQEEKLCSKISRYFFGDVK